MREQHDTVMLEGMVKSIANRLEAPAQQLKEASERRTREVQAAVSEKERAAEAAAKSTILIAEAKKFAIATGAICALVLSLGVAGKLLLSERYKDSSLETSQAAPNEIPRFPTAPIKEPNESGVVTTNFSLFRNTDVVVSGRTLEVTAGHSFDQETDIMFSNAWCYSNVVVGGVSLNVELGVLSPGSTPQKVYSNSQTVVQAGLSQMDATKLFEACPWLSGNPNVSEKASETPSTKSNFHFGAEVGAQSVDELVNALKGGVTTVTLASPGGSVAEAIRGYEAIRQAGANTQVVGECYSACTILFIAGLDRTVNDSGLIGVHQWASEEGFSRDWDAQTTSAMLSELIDRSGIDNRFFVETSITPNEDIRVISRQELVDWNVVTRS